MSFFNEDVRSFLGLIEEASLKFINPIDIYLFLFECQRHPNAGRALERGWEWEGEDGLKWREQEMMLVPCRPDHRSWAASQKVLS